MTRTWQTSGFLDEWRRCIYGVSGAMVIRYPSNIHITTWKAQICLTICFDTTWVLLYRVCWRVLVPLCPLNFKPCILGEMRTSEPYWTGDTYLWTLLEVMRLGMVRTSGPCWRVWHIPLDPAGGYDTYLWTLLEGMIRTSEPCWRLWGWVWYVRLDPARGCDTYLWTLLEGMTHTSGPCWRVWYVPLYPAGGCEGMVRTSGPCWRVGIHIPLDPAGG